MRRQLRSVRTGRTVGAVAIDSAGRDAYEGQAEAVLAGVRRQLGDQATQILLNEGWSNGQLYLDELTP